MNFLNNARQKINFYKRKDMTKGIHNNISL